MERAFQIMKRLKKFEKNVINLTKRFEITEDMMYNISGLRRDNRGAKKI